MFWLWFRISTQLNKRRMWRRLHFHWDKPIGEGVGEARLWKGKWESGGSEMVNRWWCLRGLCVYLCVLGWGGGAVYMRLEIRLPVLYAALTPGCGLSKLSITTGVNAPHQKGCVSMRGSSLCQLRVHLDKVADSLYTHRKSGHLEFDSKTAVFFTPPSPLHPHPSLLSRMQMGEPFRCHAVCSFRVTGQYILIRAALPWEAGT